MTALDIDPIDLEVLRSRLESIGEQACRAVEQTAISPTVTEAKDYSVTLLDAGGALIIGSGVVVYHYGAAVHAVRSTLDRHGETIREGDVFFANDPHNGGGLHPGDVMVQQPIFHAGKLIAWVGVSAHMMDMGGMAVGSFAPDATECYQECLRFPPIRLFRQGEEVSEVWDILRNNVRMAELVEMDMRALVAGAHLATERLVEVIDQTGREMFTASLTTIRNLTEVEFRRRIGVIADGTYKSTSWVEYRREFYKIPCTLTVQGDELIFDFAGAAPQTQHFFNTKPYIVAAELVVMIASLLATDLPYNDGMFAPITIRCPAGSIIDANPPAPVSAAHMHASFNAAGSAMEALMLALGASPDSRARQYLCGSNWGSGLGNQLWYWATPDGQADAYLAQEGTATGGSAGLSRDGNDLGRDLVGPPVGGSFPDVEILENWYPMLFLERSTRGCSGGAGAQRAGGGFRVSYRPHGVEAMTGTMFGMRRWLPQQGFAGGEPGECNRFLIHRGDGSVEALDMISGGAVMGQNDWFELRTGSGGGFGDPLDRDFDLVMTDMFDRRLDSDAARDVYGVVPGDAVATEALRCRLRRDRLARAKGPAKPLAHGAARDDLPTLPLFPGVVQRGDMAYAELSGAPLARAPDPWTDGCAVLVERRWDEDGPDIVHRSWLDPETGRCLHVEAILAGDPDKFVVAPLRWIEAGARSQSIQAMPSSGAVGSIDRSSAS